MTDADVETSHHAGLQPGAPADAWRSAPPAERVARLMASMTLPEKLAQLVGLWQGGVEDGGEVAPMASSMNDATGEFEAFAAHGLGQVTRHFGTVPVDPVEAARTLAAKQRWLTTSTRLGLPALAHEECLTGLAAWGATTFPAPPSWGASFDPELVQAMGAAIGASMASLGVHQGLAPVLDVVRDARWGRVEESIGEDPYLVGTIATAYVKGVQSTGVLATLKHFVGYSASAAGRNLAPVHAGPRELADVLLVPFEMAVLDGGAASVMNSYAEVDGLPVAADASLLTGLLRERWGFTGTVVADYFAVAFLHTLHGVAADLADAAAQALAAGIDVELPTGSAYLEPLAAQVRAGTVDEGLVDRALRRVLTQKQRLGLLDAGPADFDPDAVDPGLDLDPPAHRALADALAQESVVLLANDGALPLDAAALHGRTVAVVGPNTDQVSALFGCYSFANHVMPQHPGVDLGLDLGPGGDGVLAALRAEFAGARLTHAVGVSVDGTASGAADRTDDDRTDDAEAARAADEAGIAEAVGLAREADLCVAVLGDRAGLFGRGTSGEGCDALSLELPGRQRALLEALLATRTPVVLVLLTGRPYAVGWALDRVAGAVQAFFPGQGGARAVAGVLSGRVNPSGRLPLSLPGSPDAQPTTYLHPPLGAASPVSNVDPTPARPFGHGLSYTTFTHSDLDVAPLAPTDGSFTVTCTVANTGGREGADVVQLYAADPVASTTRPVAALVGYARVALAAGDSARVSFDVPTTRLAFTDRRGVRVVEPGRIDLWVGPDCATRETTATVHLDGPVHPVTPADRRLVRVEVQRVDVHRVAGTGGGGADPADSPGAGDPGRAGRPAELASRTPVGPVVPGGSPGAARPGDGG